MDMLAWLVQPSADVNMDKTPYHPRPRPETDTAKTNLGFKAWAALHEKMQSGLNIQMEKRDYLFLSDKTRNKKRTGFSILTQRAHTHYLLKYRTHTHG